MEESRTIQEKGKKTQIKNNNRPNSFLLRVKRLPSSERLPLEVFSVEFLLCIFSLKLSFIIQQLN